MATTDVTETLDQALALTGVCSVRVRHRPRLLNDNGPAYVSKDLRDYLHEQGMTHTRGRPYHPQTQGKIERQSYVQVECVPCGQTYERRLSNIIRGDSRRCQSCAQRGHHRKPDATTG
jgi:transposase InsO family protein